MLKKLLMAALVALAIGAGTRPALAQLKVSGPIKTSFNTIDQGFFDVVALQNAVNPLLFHVTVTYNHDAGTANPVPAYVNEVDVKFFSGPGLLGDPIASGSGGVGAFAYNPFVFTPATNGGYQIDFFAQNGGANPANRITAGQTFQGDIFLQPGSGPVTSAYFNLVGVGSGSGNGTYAASVTPEGASLLLLLPGLIPVAVGLRRRRLNMPSGE